MSKKAKLFGYILGDGWIDVRKNLGISGDKKSLENIAADIDELFGKGSAYKRTTRETSSIKYGIYGTTSQFPCRRCVSEEFQRLGMPVGKRVNIEYLLPTWIKNGTRKNKIDFFSGYYAAEGMIPSLQSNDITVRPLTFCFSKNYELINNSRELANEFKKILEDLEIGCSIEEKITFTNQKIVKQTIVLQNDEKIFKNFLSMLTLDYCIKKEKKKELLLSYLREKENIRQQKTSQIEKVKIDLKNGVPRKEIEKRYGLTKSQVLGIRQGKSNAKKFSFPTFTEFCSKHIV